MILFNRTKKKIILTELALNNFVLRIQHFELRDIITVFKVFADLILD